MQRQASLGAAICQLAGSLPSSCILLVFIVSEQLLLVCKAAISWLLGAMLAVVIVCPAALPTMLQTIFCCQYTHMLLCPQQTNLAMVSCRCVSTSVLYGVHALISGVLTYKTHCIRQLVRNMPQLDI